MHKMTTPALYGFRRFGMNLTTQWFSLSIGESVLGVVVYVAFSSRGGLNSGGLFSLLGVNKRNRKEDTD